jgi:hypothetical protein
MTQNPWCGPISQARCLLYDESREFVRRSTNSPFEAIVTTILLSAAIEIDVALLRAVAGARPHRRLSRAR